MEPASSAGPFKDRPFGDFIAREKLGQGGFAEIYRAEQPRLARDAVLKLLRTDVPSTPEQQHRFLREARLASSLEHPFAGHVYDCGVESDGVVWIAMERVHGEPLDAFLRTRGPLSLAAFVPLCERICQVVQTAHERGIVHRDLKPSNVMVVEPGGELFPKLLDFGIAKLEGELADRIALPSEHSTSIGPTTAPLWHTEQGASIGSPPYMAPEQWNDASTVDARTDLYALGVLSYECLTGSRPFDRPTLDEMREAHASAPVPPLGNGLPKALDGFFARALAKAPAERFGSAAEFFEAFASAAGTRARRSRVFAAAAAALVAVAASLWWLAPLPASQRRVAVVVRGEGELAEGAFTDAVARMAARRLREEATRFRVVDDPDRANVILELSVRRGADGIRIEGFLGRPHLRPSHACVAAAASAAAAIEKLLGPLQETLGKGQPEETAAAEEAAQMARWGTKSLAAYRYYLRAVDEDLRTFYQDRPRVHEYIQLALRADPAWAHVFAEMVELEGTSTPAAREILSLAKAQVDASRDPGGQKILRAHELMSEGRLAEAVQLLEPLVHDDPDEILGSYILATAHQFNSHVEEALAVYRKLHARRPDLQFGMDVAFQLDRTGHSADVPALQKAWLEKAPESEQAVQLGISADLERGDDAAAERGIRRLLLMYGEAPHRLAVLADVLLLSGKTAEARATAEQMLRGDEAERALGYYRLAAASILEGRFSAAYEALQLGLPLARNGGFAGNAQQFLSSLRALADLFGDKAQASAYTDELARMLASWGRTGWAASERFERELERGACPSIDAALAPLPEGPARSSARVTMLRAAAARNCARCAEAVNAGLMPQELGVRSMLQFADCAEREGQLALARSALVRASKLTTSALSSSQTLPSELHAVLARFRLGELLEKMADKEGARAAYLGFLAAWDHADRPLPEIARAHAALERLR
jgi:serine/threonine-protein kinase